MFTADRLDHLRFEIEPALARGQHVICDRYLYSTLGYQALTMGEPMGEACRRLMPLLKSCLEPDLVIVLTVAPEEAARRRSKRKGRREVFEVDELQQKLADFYRGLPVLEGTDFLAPGKSFQYVDGNRCVDEVFDVVLWQVRQMLLF
jgi:dTMP kinase